MSIYFEKARELGELILLSDEAKNLAEATDAFIKDEDAKKKFEEYKLYQQDVQKSMSNKQMTKEEFKIASKRLTEMAIELKQIPTIASLNFAENEYNGLIQQVMNILKLTITGANVEENAGCGCCSSRGCSSCGGSCN